MDNTSSAPIRNKLLDSSKMKHSVHSRVRTYDVDRQNIVHNAKYIYWLEVARVEYFRAIGMPIDKRTFITKDTFVVAKAEIDYLSAAVFDDEYEVLTRVTYVRNSSIGIEQIVRLNSGQLLTQCVSVIVNLNPATHKPERIPDAVRKLIAAFEGSDVEIIYDEKM